MGDGPRDRRRRHQEGVRIGVPLLEEAALDDAEAVLLVDDHKRQIAKSGLATHKRLRADDDLRFPRTDPLEGRRAALGRLAPQQELDADATGTDSSLLIAKEPLERGEVLAGQELRRGHQRCLIAGRPAVGPRRGTGDPGGDRGEDAIERHGRLAAADIPLEEPVHRFRAGHVGGNLGANARLGRGEVVGEAGPDPSVDAGIEGDRWSSAALLLPAAVHAQRQLEHEQLLVDKAPPGRVDHLPARRAMDLAEGRADRQEPLGGEEIGGKGFRGEISGMVERREDCHANVRLEHPFGERIDGEPFRGVGPLPRLEPADFRMGKLPRPGYPLRGPGDHDLLADGKSLRHEGHVEPHRADDAVGAGEADDEHLPAGAGCPRRRLDDLTHERGMLAGDQRLDGMGPGEVAVVAGEMHERVGGRDQAELPQLFGPQCADAGQPLERGREAPRPPGCRRRARHASGCRRRRGGGGGIGGGVVGGGHEGSLSAPLPSAWAPARTLRCQPFFSSGW